MKLQTQRRLIFLSGCAAGGGYQVNAMVDDTELLRRYVEEHSQAAFSELVARHIDLVYGAALRRVGGDAHRAEDVTQGVFIILARKAAAVSRHPSLLGWLHISTRYVAADVVRQEQRRMRREQENAALTPLTVAEPEPDWDRLRPWIDDALDALGQRDRDAVLMRFFAGRSWAEIGSQLRVSEDAARKRVSYALEKLRHRLGRRGVTSSSAALATALAQLPATAAPVGLAGTVATGALSASATTGATTAGSAMALFMTTAKLNIGAGVLVAAATVSFIGTASVGALAWREHGLSIAAQQMNAEALQRAQQTLTELKRQVAEAAQRVDLANRQAEAARIASAPSAVASGPAKPATSPTSSRSSATSLRYAIEDELAANPEFRELERHGYRLRAQNEYGAFIAAQHLPPEKAEALRELLARKQEWQMEASRNLERNGPPAGASVSIMDNGGVAAGVMITPDSPRGRLEEEFKTLLGDVGYREFKAYERRQLYALPTSYMASDLRDRNQPLSSEQQTQLQQLLFETRTYPGAFGPKDANEDPNPTASETAVLSRAATFLRPEQTKIIESYMVDRRVATSVRHRVKNSVFGSEATTGAVKTNGSK